MVSFGSYFLDVFLVFRIFEGQGMSRFFFRFLFLFLLFFFESFRAYARGLLGALYKDHETVDLKVVIGE